MKLPVAASTTSPDGANDEENGPLLTFEPGLIARFPTFEMTTLAGQFASQSPPERTAGEVTSKGVVVAVEVRKVTGPTVSVGAVLLRTNSPPAVPATICTEFFAPFSSTSP